MDFSHIRSALRPPAEPPAGRSAVLMLFAPLDGRPHVLFTLRSDRLSAHPGEMSFPGGRVEAQDASIEAAALRETHEETGIRADDVDAWGHVADYRTFRDETLSLFAGRLAADRIPDPTPPNDEVHRVLLLPLDSLRDARPHAAASHAHPPQHIVDRRVHACDVASYYGLSLQGRTIHYWPLLDGHVLWGITADLVALALQRIFAWRPPTAARPVASHEDVTPRRSS